ncbi:MAG: hypothetical protein ACJ8EM_08460 [Sphingomicrobium sp.]
MLSRIFWIGIAGIALVAGIIVQEGGGIFSWGHQHVLSAKAERAIEARVEGSFDKMQVVGSDGRQIDIPRETRHEFGRAVGRLVKAEAHLAMLGVRDASDEEIQAAKIRRDQARTEVETLKARIEQQKHVSDRDRDAVREQIRQEIREDIHTAVGEAVRE